jgi:hypothetical protein
MRCPRIGYAGNGKQEVFRSFVTVLEQTPTSLEVVRFWEQEVSTGWFAWSINFNFIAAQATVGFPTREVDLGVRDWA